MTTIILNIFLLDVNFDKSIIELYFFSNILHICKNFIRLKINSYIINQMFKFQIFLAQNYA